tara:strand:+ start:1641 stop:1826 length:186 start_codon:yes stop_codon:yes gene_type:complete
MNSQISGSKKAFLVAKKGLQSNFIKLTLARFKAFIDLIDHINTSFTANNTTISITFFQCFQ